MLLKFDVLISGIVEVFFGVLLLPTSKTCICLDTVHVYTCVMLMNYIYIVESFHI